MPQLILIKHSLPKIDPRVPAREWHLSDEGRARCAPLAQKLATYSLDRVVASIEPKAKETAQIVAAHLGIPVEAADGLHEHLRVSIGYTRQAEFERAVAGFFARPGELVFGEETADAAHARFASALARELEKYPRENLAIVSHGTVMSLFIARANGMDAFDLWKRLGLPAMAILSSDNLAIQELVEKIGA
ncbi:MAG: histidine phosphatase family protein [Chloroflexi bacterium]|nr:histidine phosphatase family protein [Chloroflexota bacterium]